MAEVTELRWNEMRAIPKEVPRRALRRRFFDEDSAAVAE